MKKLHLILFYILILFSACKENKADYQTRIFQEYLLSINRELPNKPHLYIVTPTLSCKGCVQRLIPSVKNLNENNITIITTNKQLFTADVINKVDYYYDEEREIDYLDLDLYSITLILTKNERIEKFDYLEADENEKLESYINKYK